jgi:hypothetical protein
MSTVYVRRSVPRAYPSGPVIYPRARNASRIVDILTAIVLLCWSVAGIAVAVLAIISCLPV